MILCPCTRSCPRFGPEDSLGETTWDVSMAVGFSRVDRGGVEKMVEAKGKLRERKARSRGCDR